MKSIEERAKYAGMVSQYKSDYRYDKKSVEFGYMQGATEQKAIDEEVRLKKYDDMTEAEYKHETAFVDWYHKNGKGTPTFSDAIEWARKETIIKVFDRLAARHVISELSVEGFKKAMEESVWK